ncbi:Asp23/Gls24 family envelope stress response protein [Actinosynnema sp. NPDC047251]
MRIGTGRVRSETTRSRLRTGRIETYTVPLSPLFESARDGAADRLGQAVDDRGSLDIHPSVLRKIAVRAVGSVPEASSGSTVKVRESGENVVDVVVRLALHYPSPVRQAAAEVRRSVADEVERLTGYHVRDVDVTVSALRPPVRSRVG